MVTMSIFNRMECVYQCSKGKACTCWGYHVKNTFISIKAQGYWGGCGIGKFKYFNDRNIVLYGIRLSQYSGIRLTYVSVTNKNMKNILLILILFTVSSCSNSDVPTNKKDKVLLMLETIGTVEAIPRNIKSLQNELKHRWPDVSEDYLRSNIDPILKEYEKELLNLYIKSYLEQYSEKEIDDILTFYKTPAGSKMLKNNRELVPKLVDTHALLSRKYNDRMYDLLKQQNNKR